MRRLAVVLPLVALALALAPAGASAARVTVRIEGAYRTLVPGVTFNTTERVIGLGSTCSMGASCFLCDGNTLAGALDGATRGQWDGFVDTFEDATYEATSILGERHPTGTDYWDVYVNGKESGPLCDVDLHTGDSVLFFPSRGREVTFPLTLKAPAVVRRGHWFTVTVTRSAPTGDIAPVPNATIDGTNGAVHHTNRAGKTRLRLTGHANHVRLRATKAGYVRSAFVTVRARPRRAQRTN